MIRFSVNVLAVLSLILLSCSGKLTEEEYYQTAMDQFNNQEYEKSISNFENLVKYYPKSDRAAKSLFMTGFICANYTNELEKAGTIYKKFLEKYPKNELAESAKSEIEMLGKDVNEWPVFKQIQKDDEKAQAESETKSEN